MANYEKAWSRFTKKSWSSSALPRNISAKTQQVSDVVDSVDRLIYFADFLIPERFLLSFGQLGHDFDTLLREVQARDMSMEKLRPLLDAEVSQGTLLELRETSSDINEMRNVLTDLGYSMKGMCSTVLEIHDGIQREPRIW
jgi:hypothetical protein